MSSVNEPTKPVIDQIVDLILTFTGHDGARCPHGRAFVSVVKMTWPRETRVKFYHDLHDSWIMVTFHEPVKMIEVTINYFMTFDETIISCPVIPLVGAVNVIAGKVRPPRGMIDRKSLLKFSLTFQAIWQVEKARW